MWVYFDRGTIQEEYDLLSENKEFVIKPLTDEAVAEVFEELIFECDDFYDALTEVMVDKFVE
jgi:hypothetical protein